MSESDHQMLRIPAAELTGWVQRVLELSDLRPEDAQLGAASLVRANLRGIDTHGVLRVPAYLDKIRAGTVNTQPRPTVRDLDGFLHYDGDNGLGHAVGTAAVRAAIAKASEKSFLPCVITRVGHLGAIGVLALEAAEAGLVAFICQQSQPFMALEGSTAPAIGNNPIAFASPLTGRPPLVFDTATSAVSRGSVLEALNAGDSIPPGWAIGPDGASTTDPARALLGSMLPMAGHKGIGFAMLVQCLAGSLGSALQATMPADGTPGTLGAFLFLVNPGALADSSAFDADMAQWLDLFLNVTGSGARYPGERGAECEASRLADGIPLPSSVVDQLRTVGNEVGLPFA